MFVESLRDLAITAPNSVWELRMFCGKRL